MAGRLRDSRSRGKIEREYLAQGLCLAGVDEVGRGCLAGPVHAAFAVLDYAKVFKLKPKVRRLIRDSKLLTRDQRAEIVPTLKEVSLDWHVASASVEEIEALNIVNASFLAMRRALAQAKQPIDLLLIDGKLKIKGYEGNQRAIVGGDNLCFAIAAAAILAKETRDAHMRSMADVFPEYGFDAHVGYSTARHLDSIARHGICPLHRKTFLRIKDRLEQADPIPTGRKARRVPAGAPGLARPGKEL